MGCCATKSKEKQDPYFNTQDCFDFHGHPSQAVLNPNSEIVKIGTSEKYPKMGTKRLPEPLVSPNSVQAEFAKQAKMSVLKRQETQKNFIQ